MKTLVRAVALTFAFAAGAASAAYPERPITFVVPWGAGGGTDTTARYFAAMMEKELGQPVNVVNRTGGSGVVGHSAIAQAPADILREKTIAAADLERCEELGATLAAGLGLGLY